MFWKLSYQVKQLFLLVFSSSVKWGVRGNHAVVINKQQHRQKHLKKSRLNKNLEGGRSFIWSSCYHPCYFCCLSPSVLEGVNIIRWIPMWCIFDCYFIMCIPFSAYFFLVVYLSAKFGKLSAGWCCVEWADCLSRQVTWFCTS